MKKLLSCILTAVLLLTSLSSCEFFVKGVTVEQGEAYTKITFDNFEGRKTISLTHDSPNEGSLYYKTALTNGSLQASYDLGFLWDTQTLFEASADSNSSGPGYYIDSSVSKITVTFEAATPVTGEVILSFAPIDDHAHTYVWLTDENSHQKKYTCQCLTRDLSALHSDTDENKVCDVCQYVMTGHQHTLEWGMDALSHCYSYTCGCSTPPNAALHSDGNGDGKCDVCEYPLAEQTR